MRISGLNGAARQRGLGATGTLTAATALAVLFGTPWVAHAQQELEIVRINVPASAKPGDTVSFRIGVQNLGAATEIRYSADLGNVTDKADFQGVQTSESGTESYQAPLLTWVGPINGGNLDGVNFTVVVKPGATGVMRVKVVVANSNCAEGSTEPVCVAEVPIIPDEPTPSPSPTTSPSPTPSPSPTGSASPTASPSPTGSQTATTNPTPVVSPRPTASTGSKELAATGQSGTGIAVISAIGMVLIGTGGTAVWASRCRRR
ncbi:hypothetical protein OG455_01805 [Kitasatospora sp. NBC_01287]|uniref:DUF7927 domain-containing protein n=1 Tax=Kitasatospora sp. NBC_01287 TaxID=2903573 RepID=UPI002258C1EE|nr:hypothetical protein [Kitasatospora sp. NBC_01287]MCX4744259.1 hypothetical protein [Kitasatospora sp. NBC_01287]